MASDFRKYSGIDPDVLDVKNPYNRRTANDWIVWTLFENCYKHDQKVPTNSQILKHLEYYTSGMNQLHGYRPHQQVPLDLQKKGVATFLEDMLNPSSQNLVTKFIGNFVSSNFDKLKNTLSNSLGGVSTSAPNPANLPIVSGGLENNLTNNSGGGLGNILGGLLNNAGGGSNNPGGGLGNLLSNVGGGSNNSGLGNILGGLANNVGNGLLSGLGNLFRPKGEDAKKEIWDMIPKEMQDKIWQPFKVTFRNKLVSMASKSPRDQDVIEDIKAYDKWADKYSWYIILIHNRNWRDYDLPVNLRELLTVLDSEDDKKPFDINLLDDSYRKYLKGVPSDQIHDHDMMVGLKTRLCKKLSKDLNLSENYCWSLINQYQPTQQDLINELSGDSTWLTTTFSNLQH